MKLFIFVSCILNIHATLAFNVQRRNAAVHTRSGTHATQIMGCIHMKFEPGEYYYISEGGDSVCGLFFMGEPEQNVQIEFVEFNVGCEKGGLVSVVDGWELQNQFFPSDDDHLLSMDERYKTFCGDKKPSKVYMASQNVGLVQFRIPQRGQGFRVRVSFPENPRPCNAVHLFQEGAHTLRNYGNAMNCTLSIMNPEHIDIINMDVGATSEKGAAPMETGVGKMCSEQGAKDYVEIREGSGLDTKLMYKETDICGLTASTKGLHFNIGCQHSVVRLVSSGAFYNSVTFTFRPLDKDEMLTLEQRPC